jgi:hypothetical protein
MDRAEKCRDFARKLIIEGADLEIQHGLCLSESVYRRWTDDPDCEVNLSNMTGLLMGDCALHMLELYKAFGITMPEQFNSQPDHLGLELEFLGFLYDNYGDSEVLQFINDHLMWVNDLIYKCDGINIDGKFLEIIKGINGFITDERVRLI